jgi:hypothetical protein
MACLEQREKITGKTKITDMNQMKIDIKNLALAVNPSQKRVIWVIYGSPTDESVKEFIDLMDTKSILIIAQVKGAPGDILAYTAPPINNTEVLENVKYIHSIARTDLAKKVAELFNKDLYDTWKPLVPNNDHPSDTIAFYNELAEIINEKNLTDSTAANITKYFVKNSIVNLLLNNDFINLNDVQMKTRGKPALIMAAGPSLNKQIQLAKKYQHLYTIIAVDSIWEILSKHQIEPDFLVVLDVLNNPKWINDKLSKHTCLVADIGCKPYLAWQSIDNLAFTSHHPQTSDLLRNLGKSVFTLPSGGSVATKAFAIAKVIGANPIVLIGQDLAHSEGKDHADGYAYAYTEETKNTRAETGFNTEGYYGDVVRTERQLLSYKVWFEREIQSDPNTLVINATEGGAKIKGALQIPFQDICIEISSNFSKKSAIFDFSIAQSNEKIDTRNSLIFISEFLNLCKEFDSICEKGIGLTHRGIKQYDKAIKGIIKVNNQIVASPAAVKFYINIFNFNDIDSVRKSAVREQDSVSKEESLKKYQRLYNGLKASCVEAINHLEEVIKLIKKIEARDASIKTEDFLNAVLLQK